MSFPVNLDIDKMKILVFGSGQVAMRKVNTLVKYGAKPKIISRSFSEEARSVIYKHQLEFMIRQIGLNSNLELKELIEDFELIIAATDNEEINKLISKLTREEGKLINSSSGRENSNLIFNSIINKGKLYIGITADGASPAYAKYIKNKVNELIDEIDEKEDIEKKLDLLYELRNIALEKVSDKKQRKKYLSGLLALTNDQLMDELNSQLRK